MRQEFPKYKDAQEAIIHFVNEFLYTYNHDGLFIFSDLSGTNKSQTFILKHNMFRRLALVTCSTQLMIFKQISLFPFVEKWKLFENWRYKTKQIKD